jgi:hypothetical protein
VAIATSVVDFAHHEGAPLPRIRIPIERHPLTHSCTTCELARSAAECVAPLFTKVYGLPTVDRFVGQSLCSDSPISADALRTLLEGALAPPGSTAELMCHIAYHNPASTSWYESAQREAELRLVIDLLGDASAV